MDHYTLVIIDTDVGRRNFLSDNLTADGYTVVSVADDEALGDALRTVRPALVILAGVAGPGDHPAVVSRLRTGDTTGAPDRTPVFAIAGDGAPSVLACFDAGADDVVTAPITYAELRARVRALIARSVGMPLVPRLDIGELRLDPGTQSASWRGRDLGLTVTEFRFLACLASAPERGWSRDELLARVWEYKASPRSRTVDAHASRLRRKLTDAGAHGWIARRWATGYQLLDPDRLDSSTE